jgi:hypothetical protein
LCVAGVLDPARASGLPCHCLLCAAWPAAHPKADGSRLASPQTHKSTLLNGLSAPSRPPMPPPSYATDVERAPRNPSCRRTRLTLHTPSRATPRGVCCNRTVRKFRAVLLTRSRATPSRGRPCIAPRSFECILEKAWIVTMHPRVSIYARMILVVRSPAVLAPPFSIRVLD